MSSDNSDYLAHHGILGMKWGVRRYQNSDGSLTEAGKNRYRVPYSTKRTARKDAKEYARAKMYYGKGAGNRRKLIDATVKQRSKDPVYKEQFEKYLAKQDMAQHAAKARSERHRKDAVEKTAKISRSVKNAYLQNYQYVSLGGMAIYAVLHKTGLDRKIASEAVNVLNTAIRSVKNVRI